MCLEPNLGYCKADQYSTTRDYFNEMAKFSSAPYNCTIPPTVFTYKVLKDISDFRMPNDSLSSSSYRDKSVCLGLIISSILTISCVLIGSRS